MGFSGLFQGRGIHVQIEETVHTSSILVSCIGVPPEGPEFELFHGCERARFDFVHREDALRFSKRLAFAFGITDSAYGAGYDALAVEPLQVEAAVPPALPETTPDGAKEG